MSHATYYTSHDADTTVAKFRQRYLTVLLLIMGAGVGAAVAYFKSREKQVSKGTQIINLLRTGVEQGNKIAHEGLHKLENEYSTLREFAEEKLP